MSQSSPVTATDIFCLRLRLSTHPKIPITQEKLAELISVAPVTVGYWERGGQPRGHNARKIFRLKIILDALENTIERENRLRFLERSHPLLGDDRPIDFIASDDGFSEILEKIRVVASNSRF